MSTISGINLENTKYNITLPLLASGFTTTAGSSTSGSYLAAKWAVANVNGITTPVDGMTIAVRVPLAGNSGGVLLSIDGGTTYYPIVRNVNTLVTTTYAVGSTVILTFNSTQTASPYLTAGTETSVTGCWQVADYDSNTTYTNVKLGHGYATCSTAAGTAAKTASLSSYTLTTGGIVAVRFTNGNTASSPTLNIASKGAKSIYYNGAALTDTSLIKAGDVVTFIYSSQYHIIAINGDYARTDSPVIKNSLSMGRKSGTTIGLKSVALGDDVTASGDYSYAEGYETTASGDYSHAEGFGTTASEAYSHAEGAGAVASEYSAHAEGFGTTASGYYSHAEGSLTTASGEGSHVEGYESVASGLRAHAEGQGTIAQRAYQHAQGAYNIADTAGSGPNYGGNYLHIVGNGNEDARSNAHTLDWDGNAWFQGNVYVGGTDQDTGSKQLATTDTATTSAAGLMSAADKSKLDGIAAQANKYSLPTASSSTLGGVKTSSTVTSTSGLTACPIISGVPYYKDTTYTSLKNPNSLTIQGNGTTLTNGTYDGSAAKTVNITPSSIDAISSSSTSVQTIAGGLVVGKTSTSGVSGTGVGRIMFTGQSNPLIGVQSTDSSGTGKTPYYIQTVASDDKLYIGPTSAKALNFDSNGNMSSPANLSISGTISEGGTALSSKYAPISHNQASSTINKMTGYSKPSSTSAIAASDTLNAAIGKLEKALDGKGTSNLAIGTTSTTAAAGNHTHSTYAPKASPALTGTPTAPTAAAGTNTTQIATTAFVKTAVDNAMSNNSQITYGTTDLVAGTSTLATGTLYFVYE